MATVVAAKSQGDASGSVSKDSDVAMGFVPSNRSESKRQNQLLMADGAADCVDLI